MKVRQGCAMEPRFQLHEVVANGCHHLEREMRNRRSPEPFSSPDERTRAGCSGRRRLQHNQRIGTLQHGSSRLRVSVLIGVPGPVLVESLRQPTSTMQWRIGGGYTWKAKALTVVSTDAALSCIGAAPAERGSSHGAALPQ